jgi:hypothetical protein
MSAEKTIKEARRWFITAEDDAVDEFLDEKQEERAYGKS